MQKELGGTRKERYVKYLEDIEIACGEMKKVKLFPAEEVVCDFYAIPSHNQQAYYAVVYCDQSGWKIVYAKPQIYTPTNPVELGDPIRMYDFYTCREVMEKSVSHLNWQGQIVIGMKQIPDEFVKRMDDMRESLPVKYILEGEQIVICDGVFQAIRFFERGQIAKEIVYELADQIPVGKKELVPELEQLYLTVGKIIA